MSAIEEGEYPGTRLRKHRHDLGHEDHGPKLAAGTTRAIQILLGLWIGLTLVLVVYALVGSAGPRSASPPTSGSATSFDRPGPSRSPSGALWEVKFLPPGA